MVHDDEQPSPPLMLSSSHASFARTKPSPHTAWHDVGAVATSHTNPVSSAHVDEQASTLLRLASSHCSLPCTMPSPQRWHTLVDAGAPPVAGAHVHPSSTAHADEQPSPSSTLPSSHASGAATTPSPQPRSCASVTTTFESAP